MASKLSLKNGRSELSIVHRDGQPAKTIYTDGLTNAVDTVADMEALITSADTSAYDGTVCFVKDLDRGGSFIYDSTKVSEDNQGTNFNGWIRQYDGAVNVKWFGDKGTEADNILTCNKAFLSGHYTYKIPSDFYYGFSEKYNTMLSDLLTLPNRDFIIEDESISPYGASDHQGAQIRTFLNHKDATAGQHDGFTFLYAKHHIGKSYTLVGDGIQPDGNLVRNATDFYSINGVTRWGIGMGGDTVTPATSGQPTDAEELEVTGFKIIANKLRGVDGLTNVLNISADHAHFGVFAGTNPAYKFHFRMPEVDADKNFKIETEGGGTAYPILNIGKYGQSYFKWVYNVDGFTLDTNIGNNKLTFTNDASTTMLKAQSSSGYSSLNCTSVGGEFKFSSGINVSKLYIDGTNIKVETVDGDRLILNKRGNLKVDCGISGNTTTTDGRPDASYCESGTMMFDTDLGEPIWLPDNSSNTWVDATGAAV